MSKVCDSTLSVVTLCLSAVLLCLQCDESVIVCQSVCVSVSEILIVLAWKVNNLNTLNRLQAKLSPNCVYATSNYEKVMYAMNERAVI